MTLETQTIATPKAMQSRLLNLRQPKMTRLCVVFVQPRCHLEQLQLDVGGLFEPRSPPPHAEAHRHRHPPQHTATARAVRVTFPAEACS